MRRLMEKMMNGMKEEMRRERTENRKHFSEMLRELKEDMNESWKSIMMDLKELTDENSKLKKKTERLQKELDEEKAARRLNNEKSNGEIKAALSKINDMDNYLRGNNLEIHGVPVSENLEVACTKILKVVEPTITRKDVERMRRIGNPKHKDGNEKGSLPILVIMKSKEQKLKIIKNKKKLVGVEFGKLGINAKKIFINENLTNQSKALLFKANTQRKEKEWKFIWTSNGNIYLRKDEGSPIMHIRDERDLVKIC